MFYFSMTKTMLVQVTHFNISFSIVFKIFVFESFNILYEFIFLQLISSKFEFIISLYSNFFEALELLRLKQIASGDLTFNLLQIPLKYFVSTPGVF